jgi:membrane protein insertase Oxa1/YidC/SpoIIIJ
MRHRLLARAVTAAVRRGGAYGVGERLANVPGWNNSIDLNRLGAARTLFSTAPCSLEVKVEESAPPAPSESIQSDDAAPDVISTEAADLVDSAADLLREAHTMLSMDGRLFGWGVTLFATGVFVRAVSLPLVYYAQLQAARASLATRELQRIQSYLRGAPGSLWQKYMSFRRLRDIALRSSGTSSLKLFPWHTVLHLPIFVTTTLAIRHIAAAPPAGWALGGIPGVCPDLTLADPTGVLSIVNTAIFLWNAQGHSTVARVNAAGVTAGEESTSETMPSSGDEKQQERSPTSTRPRSSLFSGDGMTTFIQGVSILVFPYMQHLPAGYFIFWISSGLMTAAQRAAFSSDRIRSAIGLPSAEALATARREAGPPVLQAAGGAVKIVREQLEYVQQQVLPQFASRRVDNGLRSDVNKALEREKKKGNIRIDLEAVLRTDNQSGKKYVAVIRRGSSEQS